MSVAAAAIGAGAAILGGLMNSSNTSRTNEMNLQIAREGFQHDVDMWNANNEYNTPKNQMARLQDAGLNPNLVYGNGDVVGNTSSQTPSFHAPHLSAYQGWSGDLDRAANSLIMSANLDNLKAQNDVLVAQAGSIKQTTQESAAKTAGILLENQNIPYETRVLAQKVLQESLNTEILQNKADFSYSNERIEYDTKVAQRDIMARQYIVLGQDIITNELQQENIKADTLKKYADAALSTAQKFLVNCQIPLTEASTKKVYAEIGKIQKEVVNLRKQGYNIDQLTENVRLKNIYQGLLNGIRNTYGSDAIPHNLNGMFSYYLQNLVYGSTGNDLTPSLTK